MSDPQDTVPSSSGETTEVNPGEAYCSACNQSFSIETLVCPNDGARLVKLAAERDELIGRVLEERYEIRAPLGKGGMGTVYRGWQLSVDREVAIKVIHPKLSHDRSAVKRFLREARLASRLSQPNIVNVYDFGQSSGVLYLVMELLRGHTLASELGQRRRINPRRTVTIAAQLCDALEAAHAQGIVHRDLKPGNIVILDDPPGRDLVKVLDFGLAKSLVQDSGSVVTNTDALLGTPLYMAPEQIEGKDSDQRADLYSLGCILYEMLAGKPPFVDTVVSAVLARHIGDTAEPLEPSVPRRLRTLVERLLAKKPEERIQTAGEVHRILDDVREAGLGTGPPPLAPSVPDVPDTMPDVGVALGETLAATPPSIGHVVVTPPPSVTEQARPATRRYAIVAFFAVIPIGVLAFVMMKTSSKRERAPVGVAGFGSGSSLTGATGHADVPAADAAVTPDAPVDAGVDAMPDAGVKKPASRRSKRIDAGASDPDIDFIPSKR